MIQLTVNEQPLTFEGDPHMPLLWFLRDEAGLTGTKFGCGIAMCGACTVHLDGVRKRALEMGRNRLVITAGVFALAFFAIGLRMIDVTVVQGSAQTAVAGSRAASMWKVTLCAPASA